MSNQTTTYAEQVAAEIRGHMAKQQRTGVALAEHLGLSQNTVSQRLTGRTPFDLDELASVAAWLGLPVSALLVPEDGAA